jgi:hypothetical protein
LGLAACASNQTSQVNAPKSTGDRIGDAIVSPLNDLNLIQTNIPPVLEEAIKNPYHSFAEHSCESLVEEVKLLDAALGPDVDAPHSPDEFNVLEKGQEFAQNEAVGSVERTVQGVIPFRSWIRKLSGAEKRARKLNTAIAAGMMRRAFLKGIGQELDCEAPAAPIKPPTPESAASNNDSPPTQ